MDAKKCDRCGRFYEEYGEYKEVNTFKNKVKKTSAIQIGVNKLGMHNGEEYFIRKNHFDLCPICMDKLEKFLTDPNAFQCLGNCNTCENANDCEALAENELTENYTKEKTNEQI